jgi:hypothetical protein
MRRKRIIVPALIILLLSIPFQACQSADLKKAAQASEDIAISIKLAITTKQDLATMGKITNAEALMLDRVLLVLNQADQVFIAKAHTYTSWSSSSKATLSVLFTDITNGITQLQGTIGTLLNQDGRTALLMVVAALKVASGTLQVLLG